MIIKIAKTIWGKRMRTMLDLSYGIEERGIEQGIEQGRLSIVKNMLLQHMPVEDIKKYSGVTDEEIKKAQGMLGDK